MAQGRSRRSRIQTDLSHEFKCFFFHLTCGSINFGRTGTGHRAGGSIHAWRPTIFIHAHSQDDRVAGRCMHHVDRTGGTGDGYGKKKIVGFSWGLLQFSRQQWGSRPRRIHLRVVLQHGMEAFFLGECMVCHMHTQETLHANQDFQHKSQLSHGREIYV